MVAPPKLRGQKNTLTQRMRSPASRPAVEPGHQRRDLLARDDGRSVASQRGAAGGFADPGPERRICRQPLECCKPRRVVVDKKPRLAIGDDRAEVGSGRAHAWHPEDGRFKELDVALGIVEGGVFERRQRDVGLCQQAEPGAKVLGRRTLDAISQSVQDRRHGEFADDVQHDVRPGL